MARNIFIKSFGSLTAVLISPVLMMPETAVAQSYYQCEIEDDFTFYGDSFSECGESVQGVTTIGSTLVTLGDTFVNQQLNFGGLGGIGAFTGPTGRLRHTNHDGLRDNNGGTTGEFEIDEASFFGNASYDLPGTFFGGKVRVNGLVGWTGLTQDNEAKTFRNEIDSVIYGGSYLWSQGSFYSMSMIIGVSGQVDSQNLGGSYDYDVSGYFTNSVMGYTFDMAGGWKFDVRGNLGHYDVEGDSFVVPTTPVTIKGSAEAWSAGITGTVFTVMEMNGGVARPYISAAYKNVFDEDIEIRGGATIDFDQDDDYGKLEAGFDFVQGSLTYGAAVYTEFSGDQDTVGGRLGVSVKLQ